MAAVAPSEALLRRTCNSRRGSEPIATTNFAPGDHRFHFDGETVPNLLGPQLLDRGCQRQLRRPEDFDRGAAEVSKILLGGGTHSPKLPHLSISPPVRAGGAANPLVQDINWPCQVRQCYQSNLKALRAIEARSGVAFLQCSSSGNSALLEESLDDGLLGKVDELAEHDACVTPFCCPSPVDPEPIRRSVGFRVTRKRSTDSACQAATACKVGTPLTSQLGFYVNNVA